MATYIIWDPKDGQPIVGEDNRIISSGVIGRVSEKNCYLNAYAEYLEPVKRDINGFLDFPVGTYVLAKFTLSGSGGIYEIWRVD